jgi:hypothetical protein
LAFTQETFVPPVFQLVLDVFQVPAPPVMVVPSPPTVSQVRMAAQTGGGAVATQAANAKRKKLRLGFMEWTGAEKAIEAEIGPGRKI